MDPVVLGRELSEATHQAAISAFPWSGKDNKHEADHAAVEGMRRALSSSRLGLRVVIGEGEKDQAPMLYEGELLGKKDPVEFDLVVDPLECTTNFSRGLHDSMSVLLAAPVGSISPIPGTYMTQLLLPASPAADWCKTQDPAELLQMDPRKLTRLIAEKNGTKPDRLTVVVQDRPRHAELVDSIRRVGAGVALIESGSVSAGVEILFRQDGRLSFLAGTYGAPEGLILAFLARCSGGFFLGKIAPHHPLFIEKTRILGLEDRVWPAESWIKSGEGSLILTGIHSSTFLRGCNEIESHSIVCTEKSMFRLVRSGDSIVSEERLVLL